MASQVLSANFGETDSRTENYEPLVSRYEAGCAVRNALRLYVGRGCRYTVKEIWRATGVKDRVIESAMCEVGTEDWRPLPLDALACIAKFLGASFVSHYLELSGLGAFELMDGQIPLPKVLATAEATVDHVEERKRLIRRLAELEGVS